MDSDPIGISQVVQATGLRSSALRYYERQGLIRPTDRAGGRRRYDSGVIRRIAIIRLLQDVGFTIAEISQVLNTRGRRGWRPMAQEKLSEIDSQLERIQAARKLLVSALSCDCSELDSCGLVDRPNSHHKAIHQITTRRIGM